MAFIPLLREELSPEIEMIAQKELGETALVKKKSLEDLKKLIQLEPDFHPLIDDKFLLMFLRCKKHDVQKAFETLKNFYRFKEKYSGTYTDFLPSELKKFMEMNICTYSPFRDHYGRAVCIFRLDFVVPQRSCMRRIFFHMNVPLLHQALMAVERFGSVTPTRSLYDWEKYSVEDLVATCFLILCVTINRLEATSVCGYVLIWDLKNYSTDMLFKYTSPKFILFLAKCLKNCFPVRLKGMHVINEPNLYKVIYNVLKLVMPKKLMERYVLHGNYIEGLHKYLPPEILPEELGGKLGPINSAELVNYVLSQEPFFIQMRQTGFKKQNFSTIG